MTAKKLQIGDKAPDFNVVDQDGKKFTLSDYIGKKIILYFYPKDDTPGCTAEACNLRDGYEKLKNIGFEIVGVSPDSPKSHQKFVSKYNLPFRLISDIDHSIATLYNSWGEKKMYGKTYEGILRTTFLIDEKRIIEEIFTKVETSDHVNQILNSIEKP